MDEQKNTYSGFARVIFMACVLGFIGYNTWHAVSMVLPNDNWTPWLAMALFDGGAFAGYLMLIGEASGRQQRDMAKGILWGDFVMSIGMIAGRLGLLQPAWIEYILLGSAAFNGFALYYYDTNSPKIIEQMQKQDERDAKVEEARKSRKLLFEESMEQARTEIIRQARAMGKLMALRYQVDVKRMMRLPLNAEEEMVFSKDVIDLEAIPVSDDTPLLTQTPSRVDALLEALKAFFTRGPQRQSRYMPSKQEALSNSNEQKNEDQNQSE